MKTQQNVQYILNKKLTQGQKRNPSFSLRAFAKMLDISAAALSEIMKGRRRISLAMATKIAHKLSLSPQETEFFLKGIEEKLGRDTKYKKSNQQEKIERVLQQQQFETISEWTHYAILSLVQTKDFVSSPEWIAERLGVSVKKVQQSLKNLFDLSLIELTQDSKIVKTMNQIATSEDVVDLSIQRAHLNDLEVIREKIDINVLERDYCSFTLPVDTNLLSEAKKIIRRAQDDIYELMKFGEPNEVYRLNSYLYPLSTKPKRKN